MTAPPAPQASSGMHWLMDLCDCDCQRELLEYADRLRERCVQACRDAGMRVVGERFHQFEPRGVTGVVLLAESHLAVHTWPEIRFAALDIYVCDHSQANTAKGAALVQAMQQMFRATAVSQRCLPRESVALCAHA
jgi:S-adenosylmethionine decarboxylase proenzyme